MRGPVVSVVVIGAALAAAAPAGAQSPYGGGLMPGARGTGTYTPTMGIVLQPQGTTIVIRFDTSLRCGRQIYERVVGRATVPFDGRSFSASKKGSRIRLIGGRIRYSWRLSGQADGTVASGVLHITGMRRLNGRSARCKRGPDRPFSARVAGAPTGAPIPPARAGFGGLSEMRVGGLPAPVMLKVSRNGRKIGSLWVARAACGDGVPLFFTNYTPPMRIRADGSFSRSERFTVRFGDGTLRYRVRFAGRTSGQAANGTLRARVRIFSRNGKRLRTRCDTGVRNWSAGMLP